MVYIIIGGSRAGKTQVAINSFIKDKKIEEKKDLIPYTEVEDYILLGKYSPEGRRKGTDLVARQDIPKFYDQIVRLLDTGKDIVIEGDKITSDNLFNQLKEAGIKCKLYFVRCSAETSIKRCREHNDNFKESNLKALITKCINRFDKWKDDFDGEIIDTDGEVDFTKISIDDSFKDYRKARTGMKHKNFAVFILSHGRANNVKTLKTLDRGHYTGETIIICDNEDDQLEDYKKLGKKVVVFDKLKEMERTDTEDNFKDHRLVVYARNVCHDIAKELGLDYFLVLDDDYHEIALKYVRSHKLMSKDVRELDVLFDTMLNFLDVSGALTVAMAQGGDFIGGADNGNLEKGIGRKAMNSFFCRTDRPFKFTGSTNEDVNAYITYGMRGKLMFTIYKAVIEQATTQKSAGGLTDIYLDNGTYVKSFYSVICQPSCARVAIMNSRHPRIHHKIYWNNCTPMIINERYKK